MYRLFHLKTTLFILALAMLTLPAAVQADRTKGGFHGTMMAQLSQEEQKIVQDLMEKHHDQMVEMHKKIFAKKAELNAAMAQEKFDGAKAHALAKEIVAMESDLMMKKLKLFIEMREKGVSYYGACMTGGRMSPCMMGGGMGSGMSDRGMMGGGTMMDGGMQGGTAEDSRKK